MCSSICVSFALVFSPDLVIQCRQHLIKTQAIEREQRLCLELAKKLIRVSQRKVAEAENTMIQPVPVELRTRIVCRVLLDALQTQGEAREVLQKLIELCPNSTEAKEAKELLKKLTLTQ